MPKRVLQGTVVSSKAEKTVKVRVDRRMTHPVFGKTITRSKNYQAHDESNKIQEGDVVRIEECRPYSKSKTWRVIDGVAA